MKRRVLNVRLLLILICGMVLLVAGVHVLHSVQVRRNARSLLDQAHQAREQGQFDQAEVYLARYLAFRPADSDGLVEYAEVIEQADRTIEGRTRALRAYERAARRLGEQRTDVRRRLVDLAVGLEQFSVARPHLEILLRPSAGDALPADREAELRYLLGRCEEDAGQPERAAADYARSRELDPSRVEASARLAVVLRDQLRDAEQADRVMDARREEDGLIAHNGDSAAAYLARAAYCRRYAIPGADPAADVARALELAPDDADVLLAAAEQARAGGDIGAARGHLERAIDRHPLVAALYLALGDLESRAGRLGEAVDRLRAGREALRAEEDREGELLLLNLLLADVLLQADEPDEAGKVIDQELEPRGLRQELLNDVKARLLATRGRWAEAAQALGASYPALAAVPEFQAEAKRSLVLLGRCYERLGNPDQRLDAYRRAVAIEVDPDYLWVEARMGLAAAFAALDRVDEAIEQYRIVLPKEGGAGFALAQLQILQNLNRVQDEREWQDVERTLEVFEQGLGEEPPARAVAGVSILRAEALAAQDQLSPARQVLERALARYPEQVELWVALASLAGRDGKPGATLAVLDEAQGRLGDRVELRLARIEHWAQTGDDASAAALAEQERAAEQLGVEEQERIQFSLAAAYARIGQSSQADRLWKRLAERRPEDLNVHLVLFDRAVRAGAEDRAQQALGRIRRIEGEGGSWWRYGRATMLIRAARQKPADTAPLVEARGELQRLAIQRPSWARVSVALAQVEELRGNTVAAIDYYLRAVLEQKERGAATATRLLWLLHENERTDEAIQVVQRLRAAQIPLSGELLRLAAQVTSEAGDLGQALELARGAVEPNDPAGQIWLGTIQAAAGEPAEPTFRRAIALDERSPDAHLLLIQYLADTGRLPEARAALQDAERVLDPERGRLALARAHEETGGAERAQELYQQALAASPDDLTTLRAVAGSYLRTGRSAEAEDLLGRIIKLGGTTSQALWARRTLATILASGGNAQRSRRALELLGLTREGGVPAAAGGDISPKDLRTRARVLALQPSLSRRKEAIAILESLLNRRVGTADDLALLAQLLESAGDWQGARQSMLRLLDTDQNNPVHLARYLLALLRHDQVDEARIHLNTLKRVASGQPLTIEIEARVLDAQGDGAAAIDMVKRFADGDESRLGPAAVLLEELGHAAEAEAMYRRFVEAFRSSRPEATLVLAGFLGRQGRAEEAIDLLDSAWATCPPEAVSNACVVVLSTAKSRSALLDRVSRRIDEESRRHPEAISIQLDLSNLRSIQGRYADAEAILKRLYEQDKTKASPLNNLAWLIALQDTSRVHEASELVRRAIELGGEDPDLLDTRAVIHLAMGRADEAIQDLESAIAVGPSAEMYLHLAQAYQMKGRSDDARSSLEKAQEQGLTEDTIHPLERRILTEAILSLKGS